MDKTKQNFWRGPFLGEIKNDPLLYVLHKTVARIITCDPTVFINWKNQGEYIALFTAMTSKAIIDKTR